jgi:hypothetical protein
VPVSLVLAIPDHPWTKATKDTAAVRIAMTVAEPGKREGRVLGVVREAGLDSDAPELEFAERAGEIHADLKVGADTGSAKPLRANDGICSRGVPLHGAGFIITLDHAKTLGFGHRKGLENHIRPYRNGRDLMARARDVMVIDLDGLSETEVRQQFPEVYQHLMVEVKPERDRNNEEYRRTHWWLFGRKNTMLRGFLTGIPRYIATVETAKHRVFQFLDVSILPDNKLDNIGSAEAYHLAVLSSRVHIAWSLAAGGWLGAGNDSVYVKSKTFDPFPFPDASPAQKQRIGALAEELDAIRKQVLAQHADLTLTGLYNLRDKVRKAEPLDMVEQDQRQRGLIDLICELHDRIDDEVADAYGWPRDLSDEQIVARLVELNAQRHAEEQRGIVRWLRPEYQIPKAGVIELHGAKAATQIEAALPEAAARKPAFPRDAIGQTAAVIADLRVGAPDAEAIARRYSQGLKIARRIQATLDALERLGHVHRTDGGYSLRKVA